MPNFYCKCDPERKTPLSLDGLVLHLREQHPFEKPETVRVVLPLPRLVHSGPYVLNALDRALTAAGSPPNHIKEQP